MKKLYSLMMIICLCTLINGCSWFNKAKDDAAEVFVDTKASVLNAKNKAVEGYNDVKNTVNDIEDTYQDLKTAIDEIEEAKDAVKKIGD
jgi:peptidoglycan hydrolase CwlO-like protein